MFFSVSKIYLEKLYMVSHILVHRLLVKMSPLRFCLLTGSINKALLTPLGHAIIRHSVFITPPRCEENVTGAISLQGKIKVYLVPMSALVTQSRDRSCKHLIKAV